MATPSADPWKNMVPEAGAPLYSGAVSITPGTALPFPMRAIYVGGGGNINLTDYWGNSLTLNGATAGSIIPIRVASVGSTGAGTSATNLLGLY